MASTAPTFANLVSRAVAQSAQPGPAGSSALCAVHALCTSLLAAPAAPFAVCCKARQANTWPACLSAPISNLSCSSGTACCPAAHFIPLLVLPGLLFLMLWWQALLPSPTFPSSLPPSQACRHLVAEKTPTCPLKHMVMAPPRLPRVFTPFSRATAPPCIAIYMHILHASHWFGPEKAGGYPEMGHRLHR